MAAHHSSPDQNESGDDEADSDKHQHPVRRSIQEPDVRVAGKSGLVEPGAEHKHRDAAHDREEPSDY